jgi:hypothetical protein
MQVTLRFENRDASDDPDSADIVQMRIDAAAVRHVMDWYGAFFAGDDYCVFINGRKQAMGINGEFEAPTIDAGTTTSAIANRN